MTIDLEPTAEHRLVTESVRAFIDAEIAPHIRGWDARGEVHREVIHCGEDLIGVLIEAGIHHQRAIAASGEHDVGARAANQINVSANRHYFDIAVA